jgi:zinc D-Ala-D-Ala carboxypeptidase
MGDLSKNFSSSEFECHCGCGFNAVDMRLIEALQALRDLLGVPLNIGSGCRCDIHNANIGGEVESQHLTGKAADVNCFEYKPQLIARLAANIPAFRAGGIGIYNTFVHVDVRDGGPERFGIE